MTPGFKPFTKKKVEIIVLKNKLLFVLWMHKRVQKSSAILDSLDRFQELHLDW